MTSEEEGSDLIINANVRIPLAEVQYRFTRSSGPGGQHVNKTETAVELMFDLIHTDRLTDAERQLAMQRLSPYLDDDGILHLSSQSERSQLRNRQEVTARFVLLLSRALVPVKQRKRTRIPRGVHEKRLDSKRRTSAIKRLRNKSDLGD